VTAWLAISALIAVGLVWLEVQRPARAHIVSRIVAVLAAVAAITLLLLGHGRLGSLTLLTPGAPLAGRSRDAVTLDQVQSVARLAGHRYGLRLAGWGLLPHEWPDTIEGLAGFDRAPLPFGITQLDPPAEVGVGERLSVAGAVTLRGAGNAWVILEDPAGPRDSARVSLESPTFTLSDRPRAPGPIDYRLRLRAPGRAEMAETLGVAVRDVAAPAVLVLDASPSFETAYLKRWLAEQGARISVRTAISRGRYRTERLDDRGGEIGPLTSALLGRYDAVLADGGSMAALSLGERKELDSQVRDRGLGLLITADAPALLARGTCGLLTGLAVDATTGAEASGPDGGADHRVARPTWAGAPRQSRTGIDADPATIRPAGIEPLIRDEAGRVVAGRRRAGRGRVALTLLRTPSRWILEGEQELFAAYWNTLLGAVARDTAPRIAIAAEGPTRADHPVRLTLQIPSAESRGASDFGNPGTRDSALGTPSVFVTAPSGTVDTVPLARDPFDPGRWTGVYWPRTPGWHSLGLGDRSIPFRVSHTAEWTGLEASARLAASVPRFEHRRGHDATRGLALVWLDPALFAVLVAALCWLWIEARMGDGER